MIDMHIGKTRKRVLISSVVINPTAVTLLVMVLIVTAVIAGSKGDPLALARLGTRFSENDLEGTQGYDGQFVYYIARDPRPEAVEPFLDVPAYRYQRILLPVLGWGLSLGNEAALPWVLALLGILTQTAGTWVVGELLARRGVSRWYALTYGLYVGFGLAVRLDLPEPLAYGLVAGAILALEQNRHRLAWVLFGLALFAKEVTVLFLLAGLLVYVFQHDWHRAVGLFLSSVLPYAIFQGWLWVTFGQPGVGSGGFMATPFEAIPFMGLLRIGFYSPIYLVIMLIVFGPAVVLPTVWGVWNTLRRWLSGDVNMVVLALFFNALVIVFLPFSTFRETGGLLRFTCGLVLAFLLYASRYRYQRPLNYSLFWLALNAFHLK